MKLYLLNIEAIKYGNEKRVVLVPGYITLSTLYGIWSTLFGWFGPTCPHEFCVGPEDNPKRYTILLGAMGHLYNKELTLPPSAYEDERNAVLSEIAPKEQSSFLYNVYSRGGYIIHDHKITVVSIIPPEKAIEEGLTYPSCQAGEGDGLYECRGQLRDRFDIDEINKRLSNWWETKKEMYEYTDR